MSELLDKVDALLEERKNYGISGDARLSDWRWRAAAELPKVAEELRAALLQIDLLTKQRDSARAQAETFLKSNGEDILRIQSAERLNGELAKHLKYVCMVAERLGPKYSGIHREEALHMLDGTVAEARAVLGQSEKRVDVPLIARPTPECEASAYVPNYPCPRCKQIHV